MTSIGSRLAQFWAFQPRPSTIRRLSENKSWAAGRIDQFVLAKLEQAGVAPNPAAKQTNMDSTA